MNIHEGKGKRVDLFLQISVPMSVEFDEIAKMRENSDDTTSKYSKVPDK